jgi:hypothetical protein
LRSTTLASRAILAANDQVTRAAGARDLDGLFRFLADTDTGPIIQYSAPTLTPLEAKARPAPSFRAPIRVASHWKLQFVSVLSPSPALLASEAKPKSAPRGATP